MLRVVPVILLCFMSSMCWAGATLTVGFGLESGCFTADNCADEPNVSLEETDTLSIHNNSGGKTIPPPILMIIGTPSDPGASFSANSIVDLRVFDSSGNALTHGGWEYGSTQFNLNGEKCCFTSISQGSVYNFLGLSGGAASNHFDNWQGFLESEFNVNVSSFDIHVFALHATLTKKGLIEVEFDSPNTVPQFSYLAGYAQDNDKVYSTPFTRTGLYVGVSEPSFWLSFGANLLFLGLGMAAFSQKAKFRRGVQRSEPVV